MATYTNEQLREVYEGNVATHFSIMKGRFVEKDADMTIRNFDTENHIKSIVDARVQATPNTFEIEIGDEEEKKEGQKQLTEGEKRREELLEWLEKPVFGGGQNFWENQVRWNLDLEIYGHIYLQFFEGEDGLHVNQFPTTLDVEVKTSEFNIDEIREYRIIFDSVQLVRREGTIETKVDHTARKTIIYSEEGVRAEGFQETETVPKVENVTNGLWQIQRMRRLPRSNSPYGYGGVEELIEAQNSVSFYTMCNLQGVKFGAFGMYTPPKGMNSEEMQLWLDAYKADSDHKVYPGALKLYALENVAGSPFIDDIDKIVMRKVEHMYQLGKVPRRKENLDLRSAKAQLFSSNDLRVYIESKTRFLARQWEQLFTKWMLLEDKISTVEDANVTVTYPTFEIKGADEMKVVSESVEMDHRDGIITKATRLRTKVALGIYDDDLDVDKEIQEAEDETAAAGVDFGAEALEGVKPPFGQEEEKTPVDVTEEEPEEETEE